MLVGGRAHRDEQGKIKRSPLGPRMYVLLTHGRDLFPCFLSPLCSSFHKHALQRALSLERLELLQGQEVTHAGKSVVPSRARGGTIQFQRSLVLFGCCAASVYHRIRSQIGTNHLGQGQRHQEGKMAKVILMGLIECLRLVHKDFI